MAFTQADIDKLKTTIAGGSGLQSITTAAGETYTLRSADEWLTLLERMQREVNVAAGTAKNYRVASTSKGF